MSLRKKLIAAAEKAVHEERGRILWVLDELEKSLKKGIDNRLATPQELHVMQVKLKIFQSLATHVRMAIIKGTQPPEDHAPEQSETHGEASTPDTPDTP